MSAIPEETGHQSSDVPDGGVGLVLAVLLVLAVVTALFT